MVSVPQLPLIPVRFLAAAAALLSASCGGGYTFFQTTPAPVRPFEGEKVMRYISRFEVLDSNHRVSKKKPRLYGLRLEASGKDVLPPRYTSLYVMWSDIAIGRRVDGETWERYDIRADELEPLPFEERHDAVGAYSGAHYSGQRGNEVQHQVGITRHPDGRATAWLMDHAAQVTAKVENVAALPFRSKLTRAQEAFGAPEPIHYFGPDRYLFHHQDAPGAETYALFRDQEGQVTSPPLPPLVWHFGGPVSTDLGAQEETVTSLATIVVDAERDLHWPLQADGTVPEMPEGVFGIVPISDPRNSHTFGWFVLREQNGEDAWSLCPGFAEVHQHIGARASGPTYEDLDVMIETHARGTQTVDLPTAMVRVAGDGPERWQAFRWNGHGYGLDRLQTSRDDLERALHFASADARIAAKRLGDSIREARRQAERREEERRASERTRMLDMMEQGRTAEAEALALELGDRAVSLLAHRHPRRVSVALLERMVSRSSGANRARWQALIRAQMPSLPTVQSSTPSFSFYAPPSSRPTSSSNSNRTSERIGRIYDQAKFKTRMAYLRGDQSWHLR